MIEGGAGPGREIKWSDPLWKIEDAVDYEDLLNLDIDDLIEKYGKEKLINWYVEGLDLMNRDKPDDWQPYYQNYLEVLRSKEVPKKD